MKTGDVIGPRVYVEASARNRGCSALIFIILAVKECLDMKGSLSKPGKLASQMPQCITTALEPVIGPDRKRNHGGGKETGMKQNDPFLSPLTNHRIRPLDISDTRMSISRGWHGPAYSLSNCTVYSIFWRLQWGKAFSQFDLNQLY